MIKVYRFFDKIKVRLYSYNLFFFALILYSCGAKEDQKITIQWDGQKANGIIIPKNLANHPEDSIYACLEVRLEGSNAQILGEIKIDKKIIFQPLITFTRGLKYIVFYNNNPLGSVTIPIAAKNKATALLAIYPSSDTLPENLLKIYLHFSAPMREGVSYENIILVKNTDTLKEAFLNLQPELWNNDRTVLTLWFDPGRIKRDLIPNKKLGKPLNSGDKYQLIINNQWKDIQGLNLKKTYTKNFVTIPADTISPDLKGWLIKVPSSGTKEPLIVYLNEPLDYYLLQESLQITGPKDLKINAKCRIMATEKRILIYPSESWLKGDYILKADNKLEDLAGNNLERLFDRDTKKAVKRSFINHLTFKIN